MGYTEQEIEMLVRFCDEAWPNERDNWPLIVSDALVSPSTDPVDMIICSAARLMREAAATRVDLNIEKTGEIRMTTGALDVLLREAREQGAAERAKYRADDIVLARSPLAASCVWQGVTAQAAANAFEYELHELTQEFIRFQTNSSAAVTIKLDAMSTDMIAKAREQGAAEMKERAAELVRSACHDHPSTREILANIRSLPLTSTLDERDRLDAEIAAVERSDQ